jgi:glycosyltransferase involved in cell wall biosynthesis
MKKRFSVIIATYNREDYLRQAIDSVLAQTFKDYELIVVDDGSTDSTQEILLSYGTRITAIRQMNQGSEIAYITGVSLANGAYLAFLDSDDLFLPNTLDTYTKIIHELDSPPVIIGAASLFWHEQDFKPHYGNASVIEVLKYRDYLSKDVGIGLTQSRIVMQKSVFEKVYGPQGKALPCYMNDYNLMLHAGIYGPCVITRHPTTVAYRQHESQGSRNVDKMANAVLILIHTVQSGHCSDGRARLLAKYAYLGGPIAEWRKKAMKNNLPELALKLLLKGWPMLTVALIRRFTYLFRRTSKSLSFASK